MAYQSIPSTYYVGTCTVAANGTTVTGQGTLWTQGVYPGDFFGVHKGVAIHILDVVSDTSLTLSEPWPGPAQTAAPYRIMLTPDNSRIRESTRQMLDKLASGNLSSLTAITGSNGQVPMWTGPGVMTALQTGTKGRDIMASSDMAGILGKLGPVNGGGNSAAPSGAGLGMSDGDFNSITQAGTYSFTGNWINGYFGAASAAYNGIMRVSRRTGNVVFQDFRTYNSTVVTRWSRESPDDGSTWNVWKNETSLSFSTAAEIADTSLPSRIRASSTSLGVVDANTVVENGFYFINGTSPNLPAVAQGLLFVSRTGGILAQIYVRGGTGGMYSRANNGSGFGAWREAVNRDNILGTVAQSGGLPTGAIIERGSNANGDYVRFADGTQICTGTIDTGTIEATAGALFINGAGNIAWTFPIGFPGPTGNGNFTVFGGHTGSGVRWLCPVSRSSASAQFRVMSTASTATPTSCGVMAIGRWF